MALELKLDYNQSKNGKQLIFIDQSNWVEAGIGPLDVDSATITISKGDYVAEIDALPKFAMNDFGELYWEIRTQDFNAQDIDQIFEDGVYNIIYTIETGGDEYEVTGNGLLYFNVKAHVYKQFMNLKDNWKADLCNQDIITWSTNLWAALLSLEYSGHLGNIERVNKNLEFVQKLSKSATLYDLKSKK